MTSRRFPRAGLALLAAAALLPACGDASASADPPARDRPNLLLICLDTVRADRLGSYGGGSRATTPHLDALAARGLRFHDVSAASGWTKPSVPTFFSGLWPLQHGVYEGSARQLATEVSDVLPADAWTLAERMGDAGFATAAFIENAQLREGLGFEQGFDRYHDQAGPARQACDAALQWLDDERGEQPFLVYLHLLDAHWPYEIPEEWARRFRTDVPLEFLRGPSSRAVRDAVNDGERELSDAERDGLEALYDGAVSHVDDELGRLFGELERRGLLEDTVIAVVADHGEEFLEHGRLGHGHGLWQNLLAVGWILAGPGIAPATVSTPVSLIDLLPTLLAACGVAGVEGLQGQDRLARPRAERPIFAEHKAPGSYQQSFRRGALKLVRRFQPPAVTTDRLAGMVGTRWEAEFSAGAAGPVASQLKPRDEAPEDPVELKGRLAEVSADRFVLAGVVVRIGPGMALTGDPAAVAAGPRDGVTAKARGWFVGAEFHAERLKLYDVPSDGDEIRGLVEAVEPAEGGGRLSIGGLWIALHGDTRFTAEPGAARADLDRAQILELAALGGDGAARAGWRVDTEVFDLASDPGELASVARWSGPCDAAVPPDALAAVAALDDLARELAGRRIWSGADRQELDDAAREALRAIGYLR